MIIAILNAISIISIITGLVFFISMYWEFTKNPDDPDIKDVRVQFETIMEAGPITVAKVFLRFAIFPPLLLGMLGGATAFIITREEE